MEARMQLEATKREERGRRGEKMGMQACMGQPNEQKPKKGQFGGAAAGLGSSFCFHPSIHPSIFSFSIHP